MMARRWTAPGQSDQTCTDRARTQQRSQPVADLDPFARILWKVDSKDHAVTASLSDEHANDDHSDRATPLLGTQLLLVLAPSRSSLSPPIPRLLVPR